MPNIYNPRMWTPRSTAKSKDKLCRGQNMTFKPKLSGEYVAPKEPTAPRRLGSPRVMSHQTVEELITQAERWSAEADRLVKAAPTASGRKMHRYFNDAEEQLGGVLIAMSPKRQKVEQTVQAWDRSGDQSISKGEFRIHLKSLGVHADLHDVDRLFDHFDRDKSGKLELDELKRDLGQVHKRAMENRITTAQKFRSDSTDGGLDEFTQAKVDHLRGRVRAAKDLEKAFRQIEQRETELGQLREMIEGTPQVQLGALLVRRGINVGEIVGSWVGARGKHEQAHTRELKRSEFKDEIIKMGLTISRKPVESKVVGSLFDEIDADKSGYLDLKEAKAALKKWQGWSDEALTEQRQKEAELMKLRALAARKMQEAARPAEMPAPRLPAPEGLSPVLEDHGAAPDGAAGSISSRVGTYLSSAFKRGDESERKRQKEAKAAARAEALELEQARMRAAITFLANHDLARGFRGLSMGAARRRRKKDSLERAIAGITGRERAHGLRRWHSAAYEAAREAARLNHLLDLAAGVHHHHVKAKAISSWYDSWYAWCRATEATPERAQLPGATASMAPVAAGRRGASSADSEDEAVPSSRKVSFTRGAQPRRSPAALPVTMPEPRRRPSLADSLAATLEEMPPAADEVMEQQERLLLAAREVIEEADDWHERGGAAEAEARVMAALEPKPKPISKTGSQLMHDGAAGGVGPPPSAATRVGMLPGAGGGFRAPSAAALSRARLPRPTPPPPPAAASRPNPCSAIGNSFGRCFDEIYQAYAIVLR